MMRVAYFGQVSLTQVMLRPMDCLTSKESAQSIPTEERCPTIRASLGMNPSLEYWETDNGKSKY